MYEDSVNYLHLIRIMFFAKISLCPKLSYCTTHVFHLHVRMCIIHILLMDSDAHCIKKLPLTVSVHADMILKSKNTVIKFFGSVCNNMSVVNQR